MIYQPAGDYFLIEKGFSIREKPFHDNPAITMCIPLQQTFQLLFVESQDVMVNPVSTDHRKRGASHVILNEFIKRLFIVFNILFCKIDFFLLQPADQPVAKSTSLIGLHDNFLLSGHELPPFYHLKRKR